MKPAVVDFQHTGATYIGTTLAYFANYGCHLNMSNDSHNQGRVPTSLHIMLAGITFILTFMQTESPHFPIKQGKIEEANHALAKLRGQDPRSEYIVGRIAEVQRAFGHGDEATRGVGWLRTLKEMIFHNKSNLIFLSQWSGAGSITLYALNLFSLIGISGKIESLLSSGVFGIVKLVVAIVCARFLVDVLVANADPAQETRSRGPARA